MGLLPPHLTLDSALDTTSKSGFCTMARIPHWILRVGQDSVRDHGSRIEHRIGLGTRPRPRKSHMECHMRSFYNYTETRCDRDLSENPSITTLPTLVAPVQVSSSILVFIDSTTAHTTYTVSGRNPRQITHGEVGARA